ncbi:hypothetical protein GJAV_G00052860 [Gymnothorax javanicus]|nr:hypothetical protein GJAV_G00052860 [Gymnothorax javanicus]
MSLFFHGTVHQRIRRFHINLQCGEAHCSDIALHFNPRFCPCEIVVFNSFHHGWQNEERCPMPLRRGESFKLIIAVTTEGYQLIIDGNAYYLYKHRIPVNSVRALAIGGDVTMHMVNFAEAEGEQEGPVVAIPHVRSIQGGLQVGMRLLFKGRVPQSLDRFHINLKYGQAAGSQIALHVNPRYMHGMVVVLNSFDNGRWANEVRPDVKPFPCGQDFELFIDVTEAGYQLIVNGENYVLFEHRMPFQRVTVLEIGGEVSMQVVDIMKGEAKAVEEPSQIQILTAPYVRPIFGGFRTGMSVYFQGTIPHKINRFFINFNCGEMPCCDKAFHLQVCFTPMELLLCNSFMHGRWRGEDRVNEMPFARGKAFELIIRIASEGYQLIVNGHLIHTFLHRIPVGRVSKLEIAGDVSVQAVDILEAGQGDMQGQAGVQELEITKIPHLGPIYGLRPGVSLLFRGTVHEKINRFHINLKCGRMRCADIALHFNPRFKHCPVVVMNTYRHGWKREERVPQMPFAQGADFELVFAITHDGYQVNVNDQPFYFFKHRISVDQVKALAIGGDVTIHSASIIEDEEESVPRSPAGGEAVEIPCVRHIPGGLKTGMSFYFKALVPQDITRFHINLQSGPKDASDIALHFNPRFCPKEVVVFNSFRCHWETEDRVYKMPITKGQSFVLVITVTSKGYEVSIDGQHFHTFPHRMPVQRVNCIAIGGDISVEKMDITGGGPGGIQKQPGTMVNTPFVRPIHVGLRSGMSVYVQGTIPQKIVRFHVNFKCGSTRLSDIAFHFNPRFCPCEVVVHNSFQCGRWRREERAHDMPFRKGEDFELLFIITSKGYQVNVNGRAFYTFPHRIPVGRVTSLEIGGQVFVQTVDFIEAAQDDTVGRVGGGEIMIPRIPYVGPISGGLRRGMSLVFRGVIPKRINRFHINLQCGEMACSDKALHLKVQFGWCQVVVFNSFQRRWRREERVHEMPFQKGASFELVILVRSGGYQVYVNGQKFYLFRHRISLDRVKSIAIGGDVTIQSLNITEGEKEVVPEEPAVKEVLSIPYLMPIVGRLSLGLSVVVKGTVPSNCNRFSVNLLCGQRDNSANAYHFNPRFDEGLVVLNTMRRCGWEQEIRPAGMPFAKEQDFELIICVTAEGYQTSVNGIQFCTFRHRMAMRRVKFVRVVGDVTLHSVDIIGGRQGGIVICPGAKEVEINTPYLRWNVVLKPVFN